LPTITLVFLELGSLVVDFQGLAKSLQLLLVLGKIVGYFCRGVGGKMVAEIGQVWAAKLLQQGTFLWLKMQGMG